MITAATEPRDTSVGPLRLEGRLRVPERASGLIVFAHGAGSSRLSPRNNHVADRLAERSFASLLFDLLTEAESLIRRNVFDIPLLSDRLVEAVRWAHDEVELDQLPIGLFGASTGAAAALVASARMPTDVRAVVSRGGRPDLAGPALVTVRAPTLLIVGGADHGVIELNRDAARALTCVHQVTIVPGATHLFEEPGALDQVVDLAADWFDMHLSRKETGR